MEDEDLIEGRWLVVGEDVPSPPPPPPSFWRDEFPELVGVAIAIAGVLIFGLFYHHH